MDIEKLVQEVEAFISERDWDRFHTPKELSTALSIEVAELQELLLWKSDEDVEAALNDEEYRRLMNEELADVLIYTLMLCSKLGVRPAAAVKEKLRLNEEKYPASKYSGRRVRKEDEPLEEESSVAS